ELLVGETPFAADTNEETLGLIRAFVDDCTRRASASSKRGTGAGRSNAASAWGRRPPAAPRSVSVGSADSSEGGDSSRDGYPEALAPVTRLSSHAAELVFKLLRPDPMHRLGGRESGARAAMQHEWFRRFDWDALRRREMRAPFVPNPLTL